MIVPPPDHATTDWLMIWIMHKFADEFREHALLKGGMELMLMSSERATNDLDYIFVPFKSKLDLEPSIDAILAELIGCDVQKSFHSKSGRYLIRYGRAHVQLEFNVAEFVPSTSLTTALLAKKVGVLPRAIRVMSPEVAFAHKLAAWNERRLLRDLYDAYFWYAIVKATPDLKVLDSRIAKIESRIPVLKKTKAMSRRDFAAELERAARNLTESAVADELGPLFASEQLEGLLPVLRTKLVELAQKILATEK